MSELRTQPIAPSAPAPTSMLLSRSPLDAFVVCRDRSTGNAIEARPGYAALNLTGQQRCALPLPRPGSEALTRAPSASDRNGVTGWLAQKLANQRNTPFGAVKRRLFATYGGLDNLIRVLAPTELDSYRRLLGRTLDAADATTLGASEDQLRALKTRFLGEARTVLAQARQVARAAGEPFDALEVLKSKGLVWPGWTRPRPGQAAIGAVPGDDWRDERMGLHSQRVPLEAELILGTTLPIGVGNESGIVFLRGENFGMRPVAPAARELEERTAQARVAADTRAERAAALARATAVAAAATEREATTRRAFRETTAGITATTASIDQASRAVEEAQRRAARAAITERAPISQLEADLGLLSGTDLVINFATGRAEILADSRPSLDQLVRKLQSANVVDLPVTIEGHTDARGNATKNQELSEKRAAAVRAYLIAAGVDGARLEALGMGSRQPLDAANPLADRNRRVRVSVAIPPERESDLRARLATAHEAYAASMEAHQRAVTEALAAVPAAATGHASALTTRRQARETAIEAYTARVAATNALRRETRVSAAADSADERAKEELRVAEYMHDDARQRAEGFITIGYLDNQSMWDRTPPPQLAARVTQALMSPEAGQGFGDLFTRTSGPDAKRLATVAGEIIAQQQANKTHDRVVTERLETLWAQWLGEQARPKGRFVTVSGSFGPHPKDASPYRSLALPLPDRVAPAVTEIVMPVDVVVDQPEVRKNEPPQEPERDAELSLEDAPATGDVAPAEQAAAAAAPAPPAASDASPPEESDLWMPNLPAMRVGPARPAAKPDGYEHPVRVIIVGGPRSTQEPADEQVVVDKELALDDPPPSTLPDIAAIHAASDAAKARSDEAMARAAEALANAKAAKERAGNGAAVQASVVSRGRSTSVRLDIAFARDSHVIADTAPLDALVPKLLSDEFRGRRILIAGHTDKTGSNEHNQRLSLRRAQAVRDHLNSCGVPAEVLVVQGFGAQHPVPGTDPTDPVNRRVVISVIEISK